MIKGDPKLCISGVVMKFRAEVAPHKERHAVPIGNYYPESLGEAIY